MPNLGIYLPDTLHSRIQRLKEMNIDIPTSTICQHCLEQAVTAEEKALAGDRLAKVVARLRSTKTASEQVSDEGKALGRRWAEDTANLADLRKVALVAAYVETNRLDVGDIRRHGAYVLVEFVHWPENADNPVPRGEPVTRLTGSIPIEDIGRMARREGVMHLSNAFASFCRGATEVLDTVEEALRHEGVEVPRRVIPGEPPI